MQMGCSFVGVEISEDYYTIAQKRLHEAARQPSLLSMNDTTPRGGDKANRLEETPRIEQMDLFD